MTNNLPEAWMRDSDTIFTTISLARFDSFKDAGRAVALLYVPDMNFHREGISHALKRLRTHFDNTL